MDFLFVDFSGSTLVEPLITYRISREGCSSRPKLCLFSKGRQLYSGLSEYLLAYTLMNDVIYHIIDKTDSQHALHAGAVWYDDQCVVFPGASGRGKSTLTSWFISNGFQYLTDELVFISNERIVYPLTRPVNLKVRISEMPWLLKENGKGRIIEDRNGSMISHRLFNSKFKPRNPKVTHFLFPEYRKGAQVSLKKMSPARSSLYLLRSHVNARNLSDHGIAGLSGIARKCSSFELIYGSFDDLPLIVSSLFN